MNKIIPDQTTLAKLKELTEGAEICDESGRVVGFYRPAALLYKDVQPSISEEEMQRRIKEWSGRPLPEIIRDLEQQSL